MAERNSKLGMEGLLLHNSRCRGKSGSEGNLVALGTKSLLDGCEEFLDLRGL